MLDYKAMGGSTKKRWSDDNEVEEVEEHTSDEVIEILKRNGLPHGHTKDYVPERPKEVVKEVMEREDPIS